MSIRAKILSILVCAMVLAFVVCALAYLHVSELDNDFSEMVEETLPSTRAARSVREGLEAVEDAEERMILTDDSADRSALNEALGRVRLDADEGERLARHGDQLNRWAELQQIITRVVAQEGQLADTISVEVRELKGQQRRLEPRIGAMRQDLDSLAADVEAAAIRLGQDGGEDQKVEALSRGASLCREAANILSDLEEIRYSAGYYEAFAPEFQRQLIPRLVGLLEEQLQQLVALPLDDPFAGRASGIQARLPELAGDLRDVNRRIFDINERIISQREETRLSRERAIRLVTSIEAAQWATIESARTRLDEKRTYVASLILAFLVVGVVFVGGGAFMVMRSITDAIGTLLSASRQLRRGDLDARVVVRGRDELAEVGSSFNAMAQTLVSRRDKQTNYNAIVTTLNKSIGLDETMAEGLSEVVVKTGAAFGAIYLYDDVEDALLLAASYALGGSSTSRNRVLLGEGVIGQVAKSRRMALVRPVPRETFSIDAGVAEIPVDTLLALPMVHVDNLLGVIVLGMTEEPSPDRLAFVEEVAIQVAVAVATARIYQNVQLAADALRRNHDKLIAQQADLERVNQRLEEANRVKNEFLANVTHELRTPLNSIIGFTELVADTAGLPQKQSKRLETVLRNARNLLALINDLLDISKMESGNITLSLERFDLHELIEEVVEMVKPLADAAKLTIEADVPDDLPTLFSDRMKCRQILVNLVTNAVKFTDSGSIFVETEVEHKRQQIAIHVRDSGIGMRPEDLEIIFDKFRQLDGSHSRRHGGTGLGLAITRQLCEFLGGNVSAASIVGEGSTFTVRLPINVEQKDVTEAAPAALVEARRGGQRRPHELLEGEGGKPFVLVMDNEPASVINLREGLRDLGIEVKSAFTAQDAVDILQALEPVTVVIGATLPEDDGSSNMAQAWAHIKERRVPVLLLWDGEGELEMYGYPSDTIDPADIDGPMLTETKIARVIGLVSRPLDAAEVIDKMNEVGLLAVKPRPNADNPTASAQER